MADERRDPRLDDDEDDDWPKDDGRTWLERYQAGADGPQVPGWLPPAAVAVAALVCSVVGALAVGLPGLAAGPVAVVVVLAFFSSGAVPLHVHEVLQRGSGVGLGLLMLNYSVRVLAALVLLAVAVGSGVDRGALGVSVVVCALVRVNVHVALQWRAPST